MVTVLAPSPNLFHPSVAGLGAAIADNPEAVVITETEENDHIVFRLEVAEEDKGKIIGRQGRVVQAMRTLLRVAAVKKGTRASLEIV